MNILLVTNRFPRDEHDSASPFVPDFVQALSVLGVKVIVLTPQYGPPGAAEPGNVHRFDFGSTNDESPIGSWDVFSPQTWPMIYRLIAAGEQAADDLVVRHSIDHILALWALPSGWFARFAARRHKVPYSVWCLGSDINRWAHRPLFRGMTRRILREADFIFADGFALAKAARHLSGRPCRFLPSYRILPDAVPPPEKDLLSRPFFFYGGRIHQDKGVYDLLLAYERGDLAARGFDMVLAGDGPELEPVRLAIREKRLAKHIRLPGRVSNAELEKYYREACATVIPTRSDSLPLVFSEAVQCGCPVVAYDTGDLGRFIRRFKVGRVVPPGDADGLAQAMVDLAAANEMDSTRAHVMLDLLNPARAARKFLAAITSGKAEPGLMKQAVVRESSVKTGR